MAASAEGGFRPIDPAPFRSQPSSRPAPWPLPRAARSRSGLRQEPYDRAGPHLQRTVGVQVQLADQQRQACPVGRHRQALADRTHRRHAPVLVVDVLGPFVPGRERLAQVVHQHGEPRTRARAELLGHLQAQLGVDARVDLRMMGRTLRHTVQRVDLGQVGGKPPVGAKARQGLVGRGSLAPGEQSRCHAGVVRTNVGSRGRRPSGRPARVGGRPAVAFLVNPPPTSCPGAHGRLQRGEPQAAGDADARGLHPQDRQ